jgi:hypothetical protein
MKLLEFFQLSWREHFPPLAWEANFQGTGRGRASSDQQTNCQKINSFMLRFTPPLWRPAVLKERVFHTEELMPDQAKKAADLPVDRDDLEMAQEESHDTLGT